jgi:ubiquinone/menaquinone biosynthesis C-methylase UbiE
MKTTCRGAVERLDAENSEDRLQVLLHNQRYDFALEQISREDMVLEIGTGAGFFSGILAQHCQSYTGIEIETEACQETRRRVQGRGEVIQGDAQSLPFKDGSFSAVICLEVLEHLPDFRKAVSEIHRCLKPEGQGIISVPFRKYGGKNPLNQFHLYEPGERELVETFAAYFANVKASYQFFEETSVMTLARIFRIRRFLGLASVYRDLSLGEPSALAKVRIGNSSGGMNFTLLLVVSNRRDTPRAS